MRGYGSGDGEVACKNEEIQDGCVKQKRKEKRKTKFHRQCVCTTRVQPLLRSFIYVGLCECYIYIRAHIFNYVLALFFFPFQNSYVTAICYRNNNYIKNYLETFSDV